MQRWYGRPSRAANTRSTKAGPRATSHCDEYTPNPGDRLEPAQSTAAVDFMSGKEESGDILGRPHSFVQSSLRRFHVNLCHPKNSLATSFSQTSEQY